MSEIGKAVPFAVIGAVVVLALSLISYSSVTVKGNDTLRGELVPVYILHGGHNGVTYYELYIKKDTEYYLFEIGISGVGVKYVVPPELKTRTILKGEPVFYGYLNTSDNTLYYYSFSDRKLIPKRKVSEVIIDVLLEMLNQK